MCKARLDHHASTAGLLPRPVAAGTESLAKRKPGVAWRAAQGQHAETEECRINWRHESVFRRLTGALLTEGFVPPGSVVDAGAAQGEEACYYATRAPDRVVHAVEPLSGNVMRIRRAIASQAFPRNIELLHGGLGASHGWADADDQVDRTVGGSGFRVTASGSRRSNHSFAVHALDELFGGGGPWHGQTLGFAHLDVEGGEPAALRGARQTIARDQPVLTTEAFPHSGDPAQLVALFETLDTLGYDSWLVDERCGDPVDCRNLINLPRSRRFDFPAGSALAAAIRAQQLTPVANVSSFQARVLPCCRQGQACCRTPQACCTKRAVEMSVAHPRDHTRTPPRTSRRAERTGGGGPTFGPMFR